MLSTDSKHVSDRHSPGGFGNDSRKSISRWERERGAETRADFVVTLLLCL